MASDVHPLFPKNRVFISEHLSPDNKIFLSHLKEKGRDAGFKYIWFREGRFFVRKNNEDRCYKISKLQDLDTLKKLEVYSMSWMKDISLESSILTCAPNGGPIAVMRDRTKLVKIQGSGKPVIAIYSSSGRLISTFVWNSGNVLQLGWSTVEELLCVQEDGAVLVYDMFSNYQRTFSMGKEVQDTRVLSAKVFESSIGTGVAVITTAFRVFLVNNYKEPKTRLLTDVPGIQVGPSAWAVVCEERHTRVLLALGNEVYSLNEADPRANLQSVDLGDDSSVVVKMAVSSTYQSVALLTDRGKLWLGTADFRTTYRLVDVHNFTITQMAWCGEQGVVLNCDDSLEMIPCREDNISFLLDSTSHLIQEKDCVRVVSASTHEIIQRVPHVVVDIFRINSTSPGSYLLEASKQFQKKSHRANEYIHLVKPKLNMAVGQCIDAAGHEFDPNVQKMLIKASQFGKSFLPDYCPDPYVRMCRLLRVLNAVRDPKIGVPITYAQLQLLSIQILLDMLVRRRQYFLAIQAVNYLNIPDSSSHILTHWASYKVKQYTRLDSDQIAREIAEKLGRTAGVSYTDIAKEAINNGRTELAIKLLDYEPRATLQVPLLLGLGKVEVALLKAIESGNTDLVYTVLIHLHENMQLGNFEMKIRQFPLAQALYLKYCREHNRERLRTVYMQEDDHSAQAACFIEDAYDKKSSTTKEASLVAASEKFKIAKNDLHMSLCEEQLKLLKYQRTLEEKFHKEFVNGSLQDTVKSLLVLGEVKLADKLRSEYKVPDRRYWWLRIETLSDQEKWTELEIFSKSKKSPIGYEPFVDACLKHNKQSEALKYMPKVREELKEKYISKLGKMS